MGASSEIDWEAAYEGDARTSPVDSDVVAVVEALLAESGWMPAEHLVELEELTEALPGFELDVAEVKVTAHSHGDESRELPIVCVVARHPGPLSVEV